MVWGLVICSVRCSLCQVLGAVLAKLAVDAVAHGELFPEERAGDARGKSDKAQAELFLMAEKCEQATPV